MHASDKHPSDYEYQMVVVDGGECECGWPHDEGTVLWGGNRHPESEDLTYQGKTMRERVEGQHSVELAVEHGASE